jgi:predicted GTPase
LTDLRPPADRVRLVNLKQVGRAPPTFIAVASRPLGAVYIRYLENQLRNYFGLEGNPIVINTRIARFQ